jgi:hypothetical protein
MSKYASARRAARYLLTATTVAGLALILSAGGTFLSASSRQDQDEGTRRPLHIKKDCTKYNFAAGGFCTIVESNFSGIPVGSVIHYTQALGILAPGWLDSNIVVDAGNGNKAVGRCTVDLTISTPGVCTFSDGTGNLAGFSARVDVSTVPVPPFDFFWDGTYRFTPTGVNH